MSVYLIDLNWICELWLLLCLCVQFVCFLYVGGIVNFFCGWSCVLLWDVDLFVLQYLGCEECFGELCLFLIEVFVGFVVDVL